jgi:hypothetical protein
MKGDFTRSTFRPENHYSSVLMQQGRVQLDADWNEQMGIQAHLDASTRSDVIGVSGAPEAQAGFAVRVEANTLRIGPGRIYVDGLLGENDQDIAITAQPDLPDFRLPTAPGLYLAYLDMWPRHITAVEDPDIREVALGGPDTSTRSKTVCQVKLLRVGDVGMQATRLSAFDAWNALVAPGTGRLRARAKPDETAAQPCILPPAAGYRRLENQLYRVEIHAGGPPGTATFKWSRDNGSIACQWLDQNGIDLTVSSLGQSGALGFSSGQWVELIDDTRELKADIGALVELAKVNGQVLTINPATATAPVNRADYANNPKLRRWDSAGALGVSVSAGDVGWIPLEDGVEIKFEGNSFKTGDYWLIPARTATGDVEWPRDPSQQPLPRSPEGIAHHYSRLALITFNAGNWAVIEDCRQLFPPLSRPGVHITAVRTKTPRGALRNDMPISVEVLVGGLEVECDAPIDPTTIGQPTCFVTLDMPLSAQSTEGPRWGGNPLVGFQPLVVAGRPTIQGRLISWQVDDVVRNWLRSPGPLPALINTLPATNRQIRACLTLKGHYIWAVDDPQVYLDGEVFGTRSGATPHNLRLPSGDSRRGGDFEMWFWLVAEPPPVTLSTLALSLATVTGGTSTVGTVTLSGPAPAGGIAVTLSSSNTAAATVPSSITVAAGQTSATFQVTTTPIAQTTQVVITATQAGVSRPQTLTVETPLPTGVGLNPATVTGGSNSTATVTLSGPAPAGGLAVTLSSSNTAAATVPSSTTVAAGQTSATFQVGTTPVPQTTQVVISAARAGVSQPQTLTVETPLPTGVGLNPATVTGGLNSTATVTLSGPAPAGGIAVTLSSDRTAVATVPPAVTVAAGQTSATFQVATNPVTQTTQVVISAARAGVSQPQTLTVNPAPVTLSTLSLSPTSVLELDPATGTVTLSGPAPAGGIVVTLSSSNTAVATVPSTVTVAAGQTSATFQVATRGVSADTQVTITATRAGISRPRTLTVLNRKSKEKDTKEESDKIEKEFTKGEGGKEFQDIILPEDSPPDTLFDPSTEAPDRPTQGGTSESRGSGGQAFIRPEERPEVRG